MLPLPYTPTAAQRQLAAFLKKLQSALPAQVRTRTVKGRQQHYLVQPKACSDGARTTARLLLVYAIDAVIQLRRVPLLLEPATDAAPEHRNPPPVATNCEALARARGISARAIRDHLQELLKIGVITRKNNRGWQANFELFLAPALVWQKEAQTAQEGPKKCQIAPPAPPVVATNFPPILVQDRQATKKVEIGTVEKLVNPTPPAGPDELTGNTGPQQAPKSSPQRPSAPRQATKAGPGGAAAAHLQAERLGWVTQAWHYAQKRLYPGRRFSDHEQEKAREALWYGTYGGFGLSATPAEWQRYHNDVLDRIDLVARYLERHPEKSLPSPYAEFVRGAGYFDAENARGFAGTDAWLARAEATNRERNITRALLKARQQLKAHRLGIAPKRVQAMSNVQLFRHHETKLRAFGPDVLQRYYAQVANPTAPTAERIAFTPLAQPVTAARRLS
ncbi:hypothetical protein [Hymenobacter cheonanensis]|uniref:hypothetical protein n=1 Tax=Hymenobacter sp. CA2-7 TaxID=3063993 RepID=UPI00271232E4|nr:hypothetical protein [Hymenobacter sp. CA2-7]MDO7886819.1 hypothetical protein [Hymenobacter sp. CA2-7]